MLEAQKTAFQVIEESFKTILQREFHAWANQCTEVKREFQTLKVYSKRATKYYISN